MSADANLSGDASITLKRKMMDAMKGTSSMAAGNVATGFLTTMRSGGAVSPQGAASHLLADQSGLTLMSKPAVTTPVTGNMTQNITIANAQIPTVVEISARSSVSSIKESRVSIPPIPTLPAANPLKNNVAQGEGADASDGAILDFLFPEGSLDIQPEKILVPPGPASWQATFSAMRGKPDAETAKPVGTPLASISSVDIEALPANPYSGEVIEEALDAVEASEEADAERYETVDAPIPSQPVFRSLMKSIGPAAPEWTAIDAEMGAVGERWVETDAYQGLGFDQDEIEKAKDKPLEGKTVSKNLFGDTLSMGTGTLKKVVSAVTAVLTQSPSKPSGFKPSDIVTKQGNEVTTENMADLSGYKDLSRAPIVGGDDAVDTKDSYISPPVGTATTTLSGGFSSGISTGGGHFGSMEHRLSSVTPDALGAESSRPDVDTEFSGNVQTLIRLVSELPEGVTKQTGAQIIRLTMEAMGISMEDVLSEAQSAQSEMLEAVRANIKKIEEFKTVIRKLESDIKFYQGKANELSEIIDLFILSNASPGKMPSVDDLSR